jgi:hypothetical protein|tara:strand:+ start:956 stop:1075 length:120 start_codon:yes stop_codon:yes gene_type:complete
MDEIIIAAANVVAAWDNKEFLKEHIESLRKAIILNVQVS